MLNAQLSKSQSDQPEFLVYLPLFVLPVIRSITCQKEIFPAGEKTIMKTLAKLIQLLPLHVDSLRANFSQALQARATEGLDFLRVFAENKLVGGKEVFQLGIPINADLRHYQIEGIHWMCKLGELRLNCALCDDMGLGKTVQSLAVVLSESKKRKERTGTRPINLVICPTSLTYNWQAEIRKFFGNDIAVGVVDGSAAQKQAVLTSLATFDVVICSYERVKAALPHFEQETFFYLVLDEAHKIKNSRSVVSLTINKLNCERKIALSGTPLQNRVSELWSLFNWLMPDFLEDESTFNRTYNRYLTGNVKRMSERLEET